MTFFTACGLQLTDIRKKVISHAKSSAELIFVFAKFLKARRTPRTVVPGYKEPCLLATRGEDAKRSKQAFSKLSK